MAVRTAHPETTFSHAHGIARGPADDWFDPKLHTDTDLFIDPFLMFEETQAPWNSIHDRLIDFFNTAMKHVASAGGARGSVEWKRAGAMFSFPEPPEFCLGYGKRTIFGSGSASGIGEAMLDAAQRAITAGLTSINDFGELLLFGDGFGADRISDMVCNIVKDDFVRYTGGVLARHGIPSQTFMLDHCGYDFQFDRWVRSRVELPRNVCWNRKTPVLLVPQRFLDELPKMDDGQFWEWVYTNQNEQLRQDLGYTVTKGLKKKDIIRLARRRMTLRRKYGIQYANAYRENPPKPYDLDNDPKFKVTALAAGQQVATFSQLAVPTDQESICSFVKTLTTEFRRAVEDRGIWKSFWSNSVPHNESQAQQLFHLSVLLTCKTYDVDLTPESNAGQGPVDFKFSAGWSKRALVEMKFAKSSSLWDNLEKQTPAYLKAEGIACGYVVVIQHEDGHCTDAFMDRVRAITARVSADVGWDYEPVFVDVRPRPPASKLKRDKP